jgi:hypothetical protein
VTENEKKVKAPAKAKKNAAESAAAKTKSVAKPKIEAAETKPRGIAAKTSEVAKPVTASSGPQRVPSKAKLAQSSPLATTPAPAPSHQQIAQLAHRFWNERGGHHGSHEQDWFRAERELRGIAS